MSKIVIKKKVSLEFLGEEYKDAYLIFQRVPISDYDELFDKISEAEKSEDDKVYINIIKETLGKYFISGKFPNKDGELEAVSKQDLDGLDKESAITCFQYLTGQETDPKLEAPLNSTSSMEEKPQAKSLDTATESISDSPQESLPKNQ